MVCIIDDREDVWNYAPNLVHVKPYVFFKNAGDINAPEKFNGGSQNKTKVDSKAQAKKGPILCQALGCHLKNVLHFS